MIVNSSSDDECLSSAERAGIRTWKMFAVCGIMIATGYRRAFAFVVCPAEITRLFAGSENVALTLLLALGSLFGVLPLVFGPISDMNRSRFGRRRIFIFIAGVLLALGSSLMWVSSSIDQGWLYFFGVASLWFAAILGAMMAGALMNDLITSEQIGKSSGIYSSLDQLGGLIGIGFIAIIVGVDMEAGSSGSSNQYWSFYLLQNILAIGFCVPLFFVKEQQLTTIRTGGVNLFSKLHRILVDKNERDFLKVMFMILVKGCEESLLSYKLYFVRDMLHVESSGDANLIVTVCFLISFTLAAIVSFLSGYLISKTNGLQQRKLIIYMWAVLSSVGYAILFFVPMLKNLDHQCWLVYISAVFLGVSTGFCQSAQVGLLMDTLANQEETATAKGARSPAIAFGALIATLLVGLILQVTQDSDTPAKDFMTQPGYSEVGYAIVNALGIVFPAVGAWAVWRVERKYSREPIETRASIRASIRASMVSSCKGTATYAAVTPHRNGTSGISPKKHRPSRKPTPGGRNHK